LPYLHDKSTIAKRFDCLFTFQASGFVRVCDKSSAKK
jgi:hypothetical protein